MAEKYIAQSERIGLQPLSLDHLEGYHAHMSHAITFKYIEGEASDSLSESRERMLTRHLPSAEHPHKEIYAIILFPSRATNTNETANPEFVGTIGIPRVSEEGIEIGYAINAGYWGRGIAQEAVGVFVRWYWEGRGGQIGDKIFAYTHTENIASARVLEKSGFKMVEVIEKAYEALDEVTREMRWFPSFKWCLERPNL